MDKYAQNKASPLGGTLLAVDQQTYGESIPDSGAVVERRIPIMSIYPDLRQPRRVVPRVVAGDWNGDPEDFISVLGNWHLLAEERIGHSIDLPALLKGEESVEMESATDPVIALYWKAIKLAQQIHATGQLNAIAVWRATGRFVIQDGERRWVAHQLLNLHVSGDFSTILAKEEARSVWSQAEQNGARESLNAISMARQIALLIIDMYEGDSGVRFDSFEQMVLPGECDRKYYAQVARGDLYAVKRGMLWKVLGATGLKTRQNVSNYRSLLDLDDDLWLQADAEDWTINAILEMRKPTRAEDDTYNALYTSGADEGETAAAQSEPPPGDKPESAFVEGQLVLVLTLNGGEESVLELYRANDRSFVDMLHARNVHGGSFTLPASHVTPIDATTPLTHAQAMDVATFMARRTHKPDQENLPPAALLTPAERDALNRADGILRRADPKFKGWYPAPPYPTDAVKNLIQRGFLETERRTLWGRPEAPCLRITREGCRALGRLWLDIEAHPAAAGTTPAQPDYGDLPRAKPIQFEYGSYVFHTQIERVGRVVTSYRESTRFAGGTKNTDYVKVIVLGGASSEISWRENDLRQATDDEIAFWLKGGGSDARGSETQTGVAESQPDGAAGGAVETGAGPSAGAGAAEKGETSLFAEWATETGLGELLRALMAVADEATKTRIHDLLTMTEDDLHGLVEAAPVSTMPGGLNWWLAGCEGLISELVGRVILKPLHDYAEHLKALGKDINDDVR